MKLPIFFSMLFLAILSTACSNSNTDFQKPQDNTNSLSATESCEITATATTQSLAETASPIQKNDIIYQDAELTVRTVGAYPNGIFNEKLWQSQKLDDLISSADAIARISVISKERAVFEYTYLDTPCETYKTIYTANVTDVYKGDISGKVTFAAPDSKR